MVTRPSSRIRWSRAVRLVPRAVSQNDRHNDRDNDPPMSPMSPSSAVPSAAARVARTDVTHVSLSSLRGALSAGCWGTSPVSSALSSPAHSSFAHSPALGWDVSVLARGTTHGRAAAEGYSNDGNTTLLAAISLARGDRRAVARQPAASQPASQPGSQSELRQRSGWQPSGWSAAIRYKMVLAGRVQL
jgi:hypothetical protein